MSILKIGMYASQFPVGDKDPYWNDVLALIRCDGELVDLKGNCTLVADVGYKRFTEGESHLAAYANLVSGNYSRFLINSGFDPNADWTLEYTLTPHEKTEAQVGLFPSIISISPFSGRIIYVYGNSALDYAHIVSLNTPEQRISTQPVIKGNPLKVSIQQINGYGIIHFDGIRVNNTSITAPIVESPDDYYLNIFSLASGGTTGLGTIEEIRLTQAARYGLANYVIDNPVFVQDKLPAPIYPKDPLYSDVASLLRVQQGYLYDTKLNELTPTTTSSSVAGYYLDALKFTDASHKRVVTLLESLSGNFTFEFTFSLSDINESLPFEYLLRLMDADSPPLPVVDVLRYKDNPNELVLTGFVSESIEVTAGFNRFAIVKVGTSLKCYLNGELKTTTTLPSSNPISEIHLSSDTNPLSGTLEELRLTKGIRYAGNYIPSDEVFPTRTGVKPNYLTFSSDSPFSIKFNQKSWNGVLEYSVDAQNWGELGTREINSSGNVLYLRGSGNSHITGAPAISNPAYALQITATGDVGCAGNIMTLLDHEDVDNVVMGYGAFANLFAFQGKLITSPKLPATMLAEHCYDGMLRGTGIAIAPELPATTLAKSCYVNMLYNCINLTVAPELPATVLADYCYVNMLYNCINLTVAPELPATVLADYCYVNMLYNCINLTVAPELPAMTIAEHCYDGMLRGTGIAIAPELPATTLADNCYRAMLANCINLTVAPDLPATVLAEECYHSMLLGTGIAISETQTGVYQTPWRIPSVGTIAEEPLRWNIDMLQLTSGTFTSNPSKNTTYYQAG